MDLGIVFVKGKTRRGPMASAVDELRYMQAWGGRPPKAWRVTVPQPGSLEARRLNLTEDQSVRLGVYVERLKRFVHYITEIKPEWKDVGKVHYADNSVVMVQRAKDGRERERMLVAPGGDVCF